MDKLTRYRQIVRQVIEEYASYKVSHGQIETQAIIDLERDHFVVMDVGWHGRTRVHHPVIRLDIHDGKVWLQYDLTNRPVADELVAAGIPKEDIVLAFHPADIRHHTGYAVG